MSHQTRDDTRDEPTGTRIASELIENLDNGALNVEASQELRGLVTALEESVRQNGRGKGSLTITFRFECSANGRAEITGEVTSKRPKAPSSKGLAWLNGGALAEADPRQARLPLTDIPRQSKLLNPAK